MSQTVEAIAPGATAADVATAVSKLAATLDYVALTLTRIQEGQDAPAEAESGPMWEAVGHAKDAALYARDSAGASVLRHERDAANPATRGGAE